MEERKTVISYLGPKMFKALKEEAEAMYFFGTRVSEMNPDEVKAALGFLIRNAHEVLVRQLKETGE